jgi:hypothetical protein
MQGEGEEYDPSLLLGVVLWRPPLKRLPDGTPSKSFQVFQDSPTSMTGNIIRRIELCGTRMQHTLVADGLIRHAFAIVKFEFLDLCGQP